MLERRSALASARPYRSDTLRIEEARDFVLTQVAGLGEGFEATLRAAIGDVPAEVGKALVSGGRTIMRTGPAQVWVIAPRADEVPGALTPLSHGRSRILIEGGPARDVLAKGIPLDFHRDVFNPGRFAMTGLHHTPVLVHCIAGNGFHLYALRSFAMDVWEWLTDAALEFAE